MKIRIGEVEHGYLVQIKSSTNTTDDWEHSGFYDTLDEASERVKFIKDYIPTKIIHEEDIDEL